MVVPTIKKSNIYNYIKSKFSNTSSDIKMNGTQSPGSSDLIARADHVHPTDTSRAAVSHTHTKTNITDFPSTMSPSSHSHGDITNTGTIGSTQNKPLITGSNGKITTGNFGTGANTFCEGNDSRLSNARTPTSHTHGDISNTGAIGSVPNVPIITGTNGKLTLGSFGLSANTFAEGNHTHNYVEPSDIEFIQIVEDGKLPHSKFHLYKWGRVVTLHVIQWTPAGVRNQYGLISLTIPEGFRPPHKIVMPDGAIADQHIVIGDDGVMNQWVTNDAPSGYTFNGQASWITLDD